MYVENTFIAEATTQKQKHEKKSFAMPLLPF